MKKYYTAFVVNGLNPVDNLHVTHAYFGKLPELTAGDILRDLKVYFEAKPFVPFAAHFDTPVLFGPKRDIPALCTDAVKDFRPDLYEMLRPFMLNDYPTYRPHITTPDPTPMRVWISNYVMIENGQVIWSAFR